MTKQKIEREQAGNLGKLRLHIFLVMKGTSGPQCLPSSRPHRVCVSSVSTGHGLINYTDIKAKCRHLKNFTCKRTLQQLFICLRPPPSMTLYPPSLTHRIRVHCVLIHTRKGGGRERVNQREGQRGNSSKNWVENANMTDYITSL
jgi:hypothetical protein